MNIHIDTNIGQTDSSVKVEFIENSIGQKYWEATSYITSIFGSVLSKEEKIKIQGIGKTKEIALQRHAVALKEFNDTLWI